MNPLASRVFAKFAEPYVGGPWVWNMSRTEFEAAYRLLALGWNLGVTQAQLPHSLRAQVERCDVLKSIVRRRRREFANYHWQVRAPQVVRDRDGYLRATIETLPLDPPVPSMN